MGEIGIGIGIVNNMGQMLVEYIVFRTGRIGLQQGK